MNTVFYNNISWFIKCTRDKNRVLLRRVMYPTTYMFVSIVYMYITYRTTHIELSNIELGK